MSPPGAGVGAMENGGGRRKRAHVLMLPFEEQGHFSPFLQVLYFLRTLEDITVTFCSSKRRIVELTELQSKGDFKDFDLRLVELADVVSEVSKELGVLPPLLEIPKAMKRQFQPYRDKLAQEKNSDSQPTFLIADLFLDWTKEFADELQIPRYLLFTTSGWVPLVLLKAKVEGWNETGDELVDLPGHTGALKKEVPSLLFPLTNFQNVGGLLVNTFEEMESGTNVARAYCEQLATSQGFKVPHYLPIGPMWKLPGYSKSIGDGDGFWSKGMQWLDKQAAASVVYIAFGTMANVPASLILELARGLELSNMPFLWVLRPPSSTTDVSTILPPGFKDRIGNRGLIETSWAPQLKILQHQSVGGIISHCGWNSSIESIVSGVPILTWHLHGDQPINARVIVEVLKVGLPVRKLGSTNPVVPGEDVATAVRSLMVDSEGQEVRKNSAHWKKQAQAAIDKGGSTPRNLQQLRNEILGI